MVSCDRIICIVDELKPASSFPTTQDIRHSSDLTVLLSKWRFRFPCSRLFTTASASLSNSSPRRSILSSSSSAPNLATLILISDPAEISSIFTRFRDRSKVNSMKIKPHNQPVLSKELVREMGRRIDDHSLPRPVPIGT